MTLAEIENDIWEQGSLNRNHIVEWLKLQPSSDASTLKSTLNGWLNKLNSDPRLSKIVFINEPNTQGLGVSNSPAQRIIDDLDSYGRVLPETLIGAEANIKEDKDPSA